MMHLAVRSVAILLWWIVGKRRYKCALSLYHVIVTCTHVGKRLDLADEQGSKSSDQRVFLRKAPV